MSRYILKRILAIANYLSSYLIKIIFVVAIWETNSQHSTLTTTNYHPYYTTIPTLLRSQTMHSMYSTTTTVHAIQCTLLPPQTTHSMYSTTTTVHAIQCTLLPPQFMQFNVFYYHHSSCNSMYSTTTTDHASMYSTTTICSTHHSWRGRLWLLGARASAAVNSTEASCSCFSWSLRASWMGYSHYVHHPCMCVCGIIIDHLWLNTSRL